MFLEKRGEKQYFREIFGIRRGSSDRGTKRDLAPDEVILVYNRIQQFLIARGVGMIRGIVRC